MNVKMQNVTQMKRMKVMDNKPPISRKDAGESSDQNRQWPIHGRGRTPLTRSLFHRSNKVMAEHELKVPQSDTENRIGRTKQIRRNGINGLHNQTGGCGKGFQCDLLDLHLLRR
jgi:hypothetical protein